MLKIQLAYKNEDGSISEPLPKQKWITKNQRKFNLFWGGRGPGKTDWLVLMGIYCALESSGNYVLFGRFDLDEFRKNVLPRIEFLLPRELVLSHNQQDREFRLKNGSIIGYTFLDESKGIIRKLMGMSCGAICVDQIESISENVYLALKGTLRRPETRQVIYATANPVPNWVHRRWMEKFVDEGENKEDYVECGGYSWENPYLSESYLNTLKSYPNAWKKRFWDATWDAPGGLVYSFVNQPPVVVPDSEIPIKSENPEWYEFWDYGVRVTAVLWVTRLSDNRIAFVDELWSENHAVDHNADLVLAKRGEKHISACYCCPSAFQIESDKRTAAERYADRGIYLYNATIHWRTRFEIVSKIFDSRQIVIADSCKRLIGQLNTYSWPDVPVEDPKAEKPEQSKMHTVEALERGLAYIERGRMPDVRNVLEEERQKAQWKIGWERKFPEVVWAEEEKTQKVMELY